MDKRYAQEPLGMLELPTEAIVLRPGLDHIFIQLGPAPPTFPSLSGLPTRTCVGTPLRWEPM